MVEIAEVRDRERLKAYLGALQGEAGLLTAIRVAFRAAARVLPVASEYFLSEDAATRDLTAAPVFCALSVGGVASKWPIPQSDAASADRSAYAAAARTAFAGADRAAKGASNAAAARASDAAAFAARASYAAAFADFAGASVIASAADAAANAVEAATNSANAICIWEGVRSDLRRGTEHPPCDLPALWQERQEPEEIRLAWENAKRQMRADTVDWSFWILWYERVRAGRDVHADKLAEILNPLREDDWKKGPAHVNPLFDDLLALYREEDELDALRAEADQLLAERPTTATVASAAHRSHNMPPELVEMETRVLRDTEIIWKDLAVAKRELDENNPAKSRLRTIAIRIRDLLQSTIAYCGKVADASIMAAAKVGGGAAGTFILDHYINSGRVMSFVERLLGFAG
jgi:hypothetical protein